MVPTRFGAGVGVTTIKFRFKTSGNGVITRVNILHGNFVVKTFIPAEPLSSPGAFTTVPIPLDAKTQFINGLGVDIRTQNLAPSPGSIFIFSTVGADFVP